MKKAQSSQRSFRSKARRITVLALFLIASPLAAEGTGTLTGVVRNAAGEPLAFTNVLLLQTTLGAMTDDQGRYTILNVAPGNFTIRATFLGYEPAERRVEVVSGKTLTLDFVLNQTVVAEMNAVIVEGTRERIQREETSSTYRMTSSDLESLPVEDLMTALSSRPGVVLQAGQLHVRGGRGNETKFQIDGMTVSDPLHGESPNLATLSVEGIDMVVGGMDAEYGDAGGGIINIVTKEGGDVTSGEVSYSTDDFGAPDRTYTNYDRVSFGMGGPTPVQTLNYYVSLQGTWSDTYLDTNERRETRSFMDFIRIQDRQNSEVQFQSKLSWKPGPNYKMTFEVVDSKHAWDEYNHMFSRQGYVESRIDTLADTGEIVTRYGAASPRQEGPDWVFYDAAAHTPNFTNDFRQLKAIWNHSLSSDSFYSMKLSRSGYAYTESVEGKLPWEYSATARDFWTDRIHSDRHPFFASNGDYPVYTSRETALWVLRSDWNHVAGAHKVKSGVEVKYNDLRNLSLEHPNVINADGTPGLIRNEYHTYNPEASIYVQDRWDHEGMVVNAGMRYDVFSIGSQLEASQVETRVRGTWSPRLGIAYPVTDKDVFSFHYGRYAQIPDRSHIFDDRSSSVNVRGNPDLESQVTVGYQAALQHMFSEDVFGQFAVYFKDIYGLISVEDISSPDSPELVRQWVNRDYASSRGFEMSLSKRFSHHFKGDVSYTYGVSTGLASDPDVTRQVDFLYLPISEQPLRWDQRHTFAMSGTIAEPERWSLNFIWRYGSGFPYTPSLRSEREKDPMKTYSMRLPGISDLTVEAAKHFRMWGQVVSFTLTATNLLDSRNIANLTPGNWPTPPGAEATNYATYYTETGRTGGAYLGDDINEDGQQDWVPLHDPRVYESGRIVRMGVNVRF